MPLHSKPIAFALLPLALAACSQKGEFNATAAGIGVNVVRSPCPAVGVPNYTGDITLFNPPASRAAAAIDVTAAITNVRTTCADDKVSAELVSTSTFDVQARRADTRGARTVPLTYFSTVVRGGDVVVSKRLGQVVIHFADGEARGAATGSASAVVNRAAASLPENIRERLTRKRKATDQDASIDPLAEPEVRKAVATATFEVLIGFQLNPDQLQYNVTR